MACNTLLDCIEFV